MPQRRRSSFHSLVECFVNHERVPFRSTESSYPIPTQEAFAYIGNAVRKFAAQLEHLSPRKLAHVQGRMDGKSKKQAALDAEHSENMAKHAADFRPGLFN